MRSPTEVARRALCLELLVQRFTIERHVDQLGVDEAQGMVDGLAVASDEAELDPLLSENEEDHLFAAVGELNVTDSWWNAQFADLALLLFALGRVAELPTVERIMTRMDEFLERGFLAEADGDMAACVRLVASATLRPEEELVAVLGRAATETASLMESESEPSPDMPPATVLYVLPWLVDPSWPWGQPGELDARAPEDLN